MKSVYLLLLLVALLTKFTENKVIRMRRGRVLEKVNAKSNLVKESQPRKLTEEGEDKLTDLPPRYKFSQFIDDMVDHVKHIVRNFIPGCIIENKSNNDFEVKVKDGTGFAELFTYSYKENEDEELNFQEIEFTFANLAISSTFSLQKVRLNQEIIDYVTFYVGGYLLLVGQTITSLLQVSGDIDAAFYLATFGKDANVQLTPGAYAPNVIPRLEGKGGGQEERRLQYVDNKDDLKPRLRGSIINKYLDLKNKKYISDKDSVKKALDELYAKINLHEEKSQIKNRILTEEGEGNKASPLDYISPKSPNYISPKSYFVNPFFVTLREFSWLTYIPISTSNDLIRFKLICSDQDCDDIRGDIMFDGTTGFTRVEFENSAFKTTMELTVPTKRFIVKHIRVEVENIQNLLIIIQNINRLHTHTYEGNEQTVIEELFQPNFYFNLLRAEMDAISDGATAFTQANPGGIQSVKSTDEMGVWRDLLMCAETEQKLGELWIEFGVLGEDFDFLKINSEFYYQEQKVILGERRFPDFSMYNQHYVAKRYLDLFANLLVNSHANYQSYKQLITPFALDAFKYSDYELIPTTKIDFTKSTIPYFLYNATNVTSAKTLELDAPGTFIGIQVCPTYSWLFLDFIRQNERGYSFLPIGRKYTRFDIDYCYVKQKMPAKKEEAEESGGERLLKSNPTKPEVNENATQPIENESDSKTMI